MKGKYNGYANLLLTLCALGTILSIIMAVVLIESSEGTPLFQRIAKEKGIELFYTILALMMVVLPVVHFLKLSGLFGEKIAKNVTLSVILTVLYCSIWGIGNIAFLIADYDSTKGFASWTDGVAFVGVVFKNIWFYVWLILSFTLIYISRCIAKEKPKHAPVEDTKQTGYLE